MKTNNNIQHYKNNTIKRHITMMIFAVSIFILPSITYAATLYFSPSSGSYPVGQGFSVQVLVSSSDVKMNAAGAQISFSPQHLELVSISESNSLIDVWGEKPEFSNSTGRASFEGLIIDGYQGRRGRIATLIFRAKSPGETSVRFATGSVLAYNGLGTSILDGLEQATFTITSTAPLIIEIPEEIPEGFRFTKNMRLTDKNLDVAYLQLCLTDQDVYEDDITGYFGPKTREAVSLFQEKYFDDILASQGFKAGTGLAYSGTREKLNEVCFPPEIPEQLFDIVVRLENTTLKEARDLEVVVTFLSFGRVATPVEITYTVVNERGETVFKDIETTVVETEQIIRKRFSSLNIPFGNYTLKTKTHYNVDVVDEFINNFVVEEPPKEFIDLIFLICLIIILLLIISNIFCYWKYRSYRKKCEMLLDVHGIKKHFREDKKLQDRLESEIDLVKNLKDELTEVEDRLKIVRKEVKKNLKNK